MVLNQPFFEYTSISLSGYDGICGPTIRSVGMSANRRIIQIYGTFNAKHDLSHPIISIL